MPFSKRVFSPSIALARPVKDAQVGSSRCEERTVSANCPYTSTTVLSSPPNRPSHSHRSTHVRRTQKWTGGASSVVLLKATSRAVDGQREPTSRLLVFRPTRIANYRACVPRYNKASVALYDTLGLNAVEYISNRSEIPVIFRSSNHIQAHIDNAAACPVLKMIEKGIDVKGLKEVEEDGEKNPSEPSKATLDQVALVCYSSRTTGTPKGAVLTHKNLATAAMGHIHGLPSMPDHPIMFLCLPLAHVYGRCFELCITAIGGGISYYTGNPLNLLSDVQALKPHLFPAVRVLNRIYMGGKASARAPGIKGDYEFGDWSISGLMRLGSFRFPLPTSCATKVANLHATGNTRHALWDKIVFKKVQAVLGGQVHCISSGSAPINAAVMDFLKISFVGCEVLEGYGLTETCAFGTRTWSDDDATATGTIGGAAVSEEFKLVDVPELGYTSEDKPNPRGEESFGRLDRYYKDDKQTAEAIDTDGWFHTGDVAELDERGRFKIIDRVKNIMKLSQGEYVALEKLENLYSTCPVIAQIYIHGDSLRDHLVAVVVPDPTTLAIIAEEQANHKFDPTAEPALAAAVKEPAVVKAVLDSITNQVKKAGGLKGFEIVKAIHLTVDRFIVENGTLTPTFKIKREGPTIVVVNRLAD
ncbi:hypothetical protein FRC04_009184 [Tulasnella sp. 424]|nr:hypothetical protein FRC04_009184 [Tulasnella sp. 424]